MLQWQNRRLIAGLVGILMILSTVPPARALPVPATVLEEIDALFIEQTWNRTDQPVASTAVSRTWMWGGAITPPISEAYDGAAATYIGNGQGSMTLHEDERIVQYFDKARMEYDEHRQAAPPWNVTTGLLAKELMTGELQLGDGLTLQVNPSDTPVAGDPDSGDITPGYAGFGGPTEPYADGGIINQHLVYDNRVPNWPDQYQWYAEVDSRLAAYNVTAVRIATPGSDSIAEPFWNFMNSSGVIWEDGQQTTGPLFQNPFYATGYPLTNPAWIRARIQGIEKDVLAQCFERRCLTYTPDNPDGWKVEFGNVGQHYYNWRYIELGIEIDGEVTGYEVGQGYQQPSVVTMQVGDIPYAVQTQFLQNIALAAGESCYADEALAYVASRLDDGPVYFDQGMPEKIDGNWTIRAHRVWIGTEYLNETLVREGYATVSGDPHATPDGWVRYPSSLLRERLQAAQAQAQAEGNGLWGACAVPAEIAYLVYTTDGSQLRVTDAFGGYQRYTLLQGVEHPVWSPDGSQIALSGFCIVTVSTMSTICPVPGGLEPSWSPDGSQLVFWSWIETDGAVSNRDLFIIDADGSNLRQITTTPDLESEPIWSPDGTTIVFQRSSATSDGDMRYGDLFSIRPDGSGEVNLTSDPSAIEAWPSWSPDGEWIAFTKLSSSDTMPQTSDVFVMRPDGSQLQQVSSDESDGQMPMWSPDGTTIAFSGLNGVYVVDANGTNERFVTPGSYPSWSADGNRLVFTSKPDELHDDPHAPNMYVYVINADGSGRTKLTVDQVFEHSPAWAPPLT